MSPKAMKAFINAYLKHHETSADVLAPLDYGAVEAGLKAMLAIQTTPVCNDSKGQCIQTPQEMTRNEAIEIMVGENKSEALTYIALNSYDALDTHCKLVRR